MRKNPNHPPKGSHITVEPIKRLEDISSIKRLLSANPRDLLLFTIGVNCSLRIGDILKLTIADVKDLRIGDGILIEEGRSGKQNLLVINKAIHKPLRAYLRNARPKSDDYLFKSRKGDNQPLTIGSVNALVKSWTNAINLSGNYGAHSLRKTFGYIQRVYYGVDLDILSERFNHAAPSITRRYLGIMDKAIDNILMNEI
jgi:integrase